MPRHYQKVKETPPRLAACLDLLCTMSRMGCEPVRCIAFMRVAAKARVCKVWCICSSWPTLKTASERCSISRPRGYKSKRQHGKLISFRQSQLLARSKTAARQPHRSRPRDMAALRPICCQGGQTTKSLQHRDLLRSPPLSTLLGRAFKTRTRPGTLSE